jgi:hypothetical protein
MELLTVVIIGEEAGVEAVQTRVIHRVSEVWEVVAEEVMPLLEHQLLEVGLHLILEDLVA